MLNYEDEKKQNRKEEEKVQTLKEERRIEEVENIEDNIMELTNELFEEYKEKNIELPAEKSAELKEMLSNLRKEEFAPFREELQKTYFFGKIFSVGHDGYVDVSPDNINNNLYKFRVASICGEDDFQMVEAAMILNSYVEKSIGSHILDFKKGMLSIAKELYYEARSAEIDDKEFVNAKKVVRSWLLLRDKGFEAKETERKEREESAKARENIEVIESQFLKPRTEEDILRELRELRIEKDDLWQDFFSDGFEKSDKNTMRIAIYDNLISDLEEELELLPATEKIDRLFKRERNEEERNIIYEAHTLLFKAKRIRDEVSRKMSDKNYEALYKIADKIDEKDKENIEGIKNGRIRALLSEMLQAKKLEEDAEILYADIKIKNIKKQINKERR